MGVSFPCVVCDRVFESRQGLAAHLKAHKEPRVGMSVRVPKELRDRFTQVCHKHHLTTCHVVASLMKAVVAADQRGSVDLSGRSPIVVTLHEFYLGRPRSSLKTLLREIPSSVA